MFGVGASNSEHVRAHLSLQCRPHPLRGGGGGGGGGGGQYMLIHQVVLRAFRDTNLHVNISGIYVQKATKTTDDKLLSNLVHCSFSFSLAKHICCY